LQNALKHTDAALKKHPGNQLLSSLRAFALQRTGKSEEALATLQSIVDKGPESERVLHTMTFTYRAAGKPEAIAPAYAVAAEKHPQDLEILKGLFGAYAKELNFVKQQQIALKLTKTHPEEADTYSWWAIVSLTLQARAAVLTTPPGSNAEQLMKLAETMIARQITKSKGTLPSYEALLLYTDVLQGQGKAHEAATIIKEASGTTAGGLKDDSRQLLAAALVRSGDVSAAAELFKEACLENTDDWWSWHLYLNCILPGSVKHSTKDLNTPVIAFPVGIVGGLAENWDSKHLEAVWETAAAAAEGGASIESAVQKAQKALEELKSTAEKASTTQSRGAVLAPLELACRLHRLGLYTGRQLAEAIVAALPSLCHSFSCAVDLRRYTSHLDSSEDRTWLAEQVLTICEEKAKLFEEENSNKDGTNKNSKAAIKALWCRTNAHALQQELGCISTTTTNTSTATSSAAVEYAVQMADLFASNLSLSQNLDPKDRGHGEDLVALAASSLVSAAINSSKNENTTSVLLLVTAILALEAAQVRRTVAAPLRLSACALYALLNAPKKSTAQLTALDVKSILHESLTGHWALPTLLASASPEADFDTWLSGITNLHVDQILEASESIFTAYEQGTYSKVPEFVDFWETLGASHTRWSGAAEGNILKLKSGTSPSGGSSGNALALASIAKGIVETDSNSLSPRPQIDTIRFNEDLSTRPAWFPPAAVDTRLAIASWWAGSSGSTMAHALPASSEMWWGVTGAAERRVPQAEQWRKAQRHGLARRQALPELLSGLLQPALLKNEKLASLSEVLNTAWVTKSYPETSSTVLTSPLEVSKTLFSAGVSLHQAINAANNSSTEDVAVAEAVCEKSCSAVDQFSQQFSTSLKEICELLRNEDGKVSLLPFPGNAAPAVLAAMLSEEALWAAACLPTWAKLIKSSFIAANAAQNQHLKERLQNAVHSAGNAVYSALLSLKEQLSATASATASPAAAADEILSQIGSLWPQASKLWSYESDFDAKKALGEVVAEQQAVMKRMLQLATQATTSLKQFA
jgi:N-terminal acetyltransferase B complex non-catalytic subunit